MLIFHKLKPVQCTQYTFDSWTHLIMLSVKSYGVDT